MTYPDKKRIMNVLNNIEKGKIKPTSILDKDASPIDKMKFNICQKL